MFFLYLFIFHIFYILFFFNCHTDREKLSTFNIFIVLALFTDHTGLCCIIKSVSKCEVLEQERGFASRHLQAKFSTIYMWVGDLERDNFSLLFVTPCAGQLVRADHNEWPNRTQQFVDFFLLRTRRYDVTGWKWLRSNKLVICFAWFTFKCTWNWENVAIWDKMLSTWHDSFNDISLRRRKKDITYRHNLD